jgi:hypothetical protein
MPVSSAIIAAPRPRVQLRMKGGKNWTGTDRLGSAAGGSFRGLTTGYCVATLFKIDTQINGRCLIDCLDGSGKGYRLFQPTATTLSWYHANAAGNNWYTAAPYSPAPDIGKVQLSVLNYGGGASQIAHWCGDQKVGGDVAVDGYTLPGGAIRFTVGLVGNGTAEHSGSTIYGFGSWNRALTDAEIHDLYAYVAATGKIPPARISGSTFVYNVATNVAGASFPATIVNEVGGGGDLSFYVGSAPALTLDTTLAFPGPMPP